MKSIKINTVKIRRRFDETFKREALNNWLTSNKSAEVVAQELGITSSRLYAWKQRFAPDLAEAEAVPGAKPPSASALQSQLDDAWREIRHLREQRDILKKRWAFSPNRPGTLPTG